MAEKKRHGRPTSYRPEYCDTVLELVGVQGKSITCFAAEIGVHRDTVYQWAKVHESFSDALEYAIMCSEAYWEGEIVEMMRDKSVNVPLVKLYLANRFGWSDNSKVDMTSSDGSMTSKPDKIVITGVEPGDDAD